MPGSPGRPSKSVQGQQGVVPIKESLLLDEPLPVELPQELLQGVYNVSSAHSLALGMILLEDNPLGWRSRGGSPC